MNFMAEKSTDEEIAVKLRFLADQIRQGYVVNYSYADVLYRAEEKMRALSIPREMSLAMQLAAQREIAGQLRYIGKSHAAAALDWASSRRFLRSLWSTMYQAGLLKVVS